MKYMMVFSVAPNDIVAVRKRFAEPEPLEGIKLLGRWQIRFDRGGRSGSDKQILCLLGRSGGHKSRACHRRRRNGAGARCVDLAEIAAIA